MEQEQWQFGTAAAAVQRVTGVAITVRLRGIVTAMVFEALHMRLAREPACHLRTVVLGDDALLVATNISMAEAAARSTPATDAGLCAIAIGVPEWRMTWALDHCMVIAQFGLCRSAFPVSSSSSRADPGQDSPCPARLARPDSAAWRSSP